MGVLQNKIDFSVIITAKNANPNGDPLNGNRPRESCDGFGEISDVCINLRKWQTATGCVVEEVLGSAFTYPKGFSPRKALNRTGKRASSAEFEL